MHRFHCPSLAAAALPGLSDAVIELDKDESHHAAKVLRLKGGDGVALFDGEGTVGEGTIERVASRVTVRVATARRVAPLVPAIDMAVAIPKGPRADVLIDQLSQLGCDRVIPLRARRSIVDPRETKLDRFARAAVESAKQCGRAYVMKIEPAADFAAPLLEGPHDLRLIALPECTSEPALNDRIGAAQRVLILIGPEGGWTQDEIALAKACGCEPWTLGPHVMRIETAAAAAAAVMRYR
jgi:16S rRNA (uracil1498-N3)-methyltransferase